ncbi:MAG TPA: hypothetical protein VHY80_20195 [Stellaceae bacterium]|nr:hypothetical protein [Stellaceae bacterium]
MAALRDYRCYLLGADNRIKDVFEFAAPSDEEAIAIAEHHLARFRLYAGVELWSGPRQVYAHLPPRRDPP